MEEQNISQKESVNEKEPIKAVVYDWLEVIAFSIAISSGLVA